MSFINIDSATIAAISTAAMGVGAYLQKKGVFQQLFNKVSGATSIEDTYNSAFRAFHQADARNKVPVSNSDLQELQTKGAKLTSETNLSDKNLVEHGIENVIIMTPSAVFVKSVGEEDLNYNIESEEKFIRMAWIRQFLNDPQKMIQESYRVFDASQYDKKMIKHARKSLQGRVSEPEGSKSFISKVFGTRTPNERQNGVHNAFLYGARVLLQHEGDKRITGDGFAAIRTGKTIVVTHKTAEETRHIEQECGTSDEAQLWTAKQYLDELAKFSAQRAGEIVPKEKIFPAAA